MPILLNKISTKGGRGGQKSPKSCLRRIRTAPLQNQCITIIVTKARKRTIEDDNIYVSDFKVVLGLTICAELTNKPKPK